MIQAIIFDCFGVLTASLYQQGERPNEALLEYIAALRHRGYKTAILSNTSIKTLQRIFTPDQLVLFDELIVSADVHITKPDPRIYELAVKRLAILPENCVFTDDSEANIKAAQTLGMQAIPYTQFAAFKSILEALLAAEPVSSES